MISRSLTLSDPKSPNRLHFVAEARPRNIGEGVRDRPRNSSRQADDVYDVSGLTHDDVMMSRKDRG